VNTLHIKINNPGYLSPSDVTHAVKGYGACSLTLSLMMPFVYLFKDEYFGKENIH